MTNWTSCVEAFITQSHPVHLQPPESRSQLLLAPSPNAAQQHELAFGMRSDEEEQQAGEEEQQAGEEEQQAGEEEQQK